MPAAAEKKTRNFKMPTASELYAKRQSPPKEVPVWVYLENEMQANIKFKPYNTKVGEWLKFLKDLKRFYRKQMRMHYNKINKSIGPPWYIEFSNGQKNILSEFKTYIEAGILENRPDRVRSGLKELGVVVKLSDDALMLPLLRSREDVGMFFWHLFQMMYHAVPSQSLPSYDTNAQLIMSAMVFIDLKECKEELNKRLAKKPPHPPKKPKKEVRYFEPKVRFGEYLQRITIPLFSHHPDKLPKPKKPRPLLNKIKIKTKESLERLAQSEDFIPKRYERVKLAKPPNRVCTYKFWEPPERATNPKTLAVILASKMFKKRAIDRHSPKQPIDVVQCHIGRVAFCGGQPYYILETFVTLPTKYLMHNGGCVKVGEEYVFLIKGHYSHPEDEEKCESECSCILRKWDTYLTYLHDNLCKCKHLYDFGYISRPTQQYFFPPTKQTPFWIDYAKIYQPDEFEDLVRDELDNAMNSETPRVFLGEVTDTPLIIPHLAKANRLKNLQEFVSKRVKPKPKPKQQYKKLLRTKRAWVQLEHLDFRARAKKIPFTPTQKKKCNFHHRPLIQKLYQKTLCDFILRTSKKRLQESRMLWACMNDPNEKEMFSRVFFSYMPTRLQDTSVLRPFSYALVPKTIAKTCRI